MRGIVALIFFGLLACQSPQKAVGYLKKHNLLADTCHANFPLLGDTIYIMGETQVDTFYFPADTLNFHDTIVTQVICPPTRVIKHRIVDTLRIKLQDSAAIKSLEIKNGKLAAELIAEKEKNEKLSVKLHNSRKFGLYGLIGNISLIFFLGVLFGRKWLQKKTLGR